MGNPPEQTEVTKEDNEAVAEEPKNENPQRRKKINEQLRRLVRKLLLHTKSDYFPFRPKDIQKTLKAAKLVFKMESALVEVKQPVVIVGDIHGQYTDLIRIFSMFDEEKGGVMVKGCFARSFVFLGDYVDRGKHSVECMLLLLALKLLHPERYTLLRGNHEVSMINSRYGFRAELVERFQSQDGLELFEQFNDVFGYLPLACLVNHRILCMHGGISPSLKTLDDIRDLQKPIGMLDSPLITDLLWADPMIGLKGFSKNKVRGVSVNFGEEILSEMLNNLGLKLVIRAHQMMKGGFNFFCDRKLITVFSAPAYHPAMNNSGAVIEIRKHGKIGIKVLEPKTGEKVFRGEEDGETKDRDYGGFQRAAEVEPTSVATPSNIIGKPTRTVTKTVTMSVAMK